MSERTYRQRLEADIARWQADGIITAASADAIRGTLRPLPESITVAAVVAIVGGMLIAAAFLAFVASNWTEIARPVRFGILIAGIVTAFGMGAWYAHEKRPYIADLCAAVGSIIFGSAIALTGQMYHLAGDFAGGMMLFTAGALVAAMLTASRGALAVALVAACVWNHMRVVEFDAVHLPFLAVWAIAALLAIAWNAAPARHLVALAALAWLVSVGFALDGSRAADPVFAVVAGFALLFGLGVALSSRQWQSYNPFGDPLSQFGLVLSHYGAFAMALTIAALIAGAGSQPEFKAPGIVFAIAGLSVVLPLAAAVFDLRAGPALAGIANLLVVIVVSGAIQRSPVDDPWLLYGLALAAMLCVVISGQLDGVRPRVVAGWLGLALMIAAITWAVRGSLLRRAVFLAAAGVVAITLASLLGRLVRKERA
jgi:uncharacterized membrane protein